MQASLCQIQELFKDFIKILFLFSRTTTSWKILIYTVKFYVGKSRLRQWTIKHKKISIKLLCFYLVQHMLHQIKAHQFYTDLGLHLQCCPTENSKIQGLFKALQWFSITDLVFKDFSRKPSIFKYFSSLCGPCSQTGLCIQTVLHEPLLLAYIKHGNRQWLRPKFRPLTPQESRVCMFYSLPACAVGW